MTNSFFNFLLRKIVTHEVVQSCQVCLSSMEQIVECRKFESSEENTWTFLLKNVILNPKN
jgi:hypothetical protein